MKHQTSSVDALPDSGSRPLARSRILAWVIAAAAITLPITVQVPRNPDVWWELAIGKYTLQHGIPRVEPFSFLPTAHGWVAQQWLYTILMAVLHSGTNFAPIMLLTGIAASLAFAVAAMAIPKEDHIPGPPRAIAIILATIIAGQVLGIRAQIATLLFTAVTLLVLTAWRGGNRRIVVLLPPLVLLWVNVHAGFFIGLALMALFLVNELFERWKKMNMGHNGSLPWLGGAAAGSLVLSLVNPSGPGIYPYLLETYQSSSQLIVEWQSPSFHNLFFQLLELSFILLVVLWIYARDLDHLDVVLAMVFAVLTLDAQRNVSLLCVVITPQLAKYGWPMWQRVMVRFGSLAGKAKALPRSRPVMPLALVIIPAAVITLAGIAAALPTTQPAYVSKSIGKLYPVSATSYVLASLPPGHIYTVWTWGGYLAYRIPNGRRVFIYGEAGIFGQYDIGQYLNIDLVRSSWRATLERWHIDTAIVPLTSQEAALFREAGWQARCIDQPAGAVVFFHTKHPVLLPTSSPAPPITAPACK